MFDQSCSIFFNNIYLNVCPSPTCFRQFRHYYMQIYLYFCNPLMLLSDDAKAVKEASITQPPRRPRPSSTLQGDPIPIDRLIDRLS